MSFSPEGGIVDGATGLLVPAYKIRARHERWKRLPGAGSQEPRCEAETSGSEPLANGL